MKCISLMRLYMLEICITEFFEYEVFEYFYDKLVQFD